MRWLILLLLLCNQALAGSHGAGPAYIGNAITRAGVADGLDVAHTQLMSRTGFFARTAISSLQIVTCNFASHVTDFVQQAPGNAAAITASVEYPQGTYTQVKFSGSANGSIPNSGCLTSDPLSLAIPNGALAWYCEYRTSAGGLTYDGLTNGTQVISGNPMGDAMQLGTSGVTDKTLSCDSVVDNSGGDINPPFALLATMTVPSYCILGDSGSIGATDVPNSNGNQGAVTQTIGPTFAYMQLANDGSTAAEFIANANTIKTAFQWCSHLSVEWGNDIEGGATAAQFEANLNTIYSTFSGYTPKNPGTSTITQSTILPRTTTTDNCATTANQTLQGFEAQRDTFNSDLRSKSFGPAGGVFDIAAIVETAPTNSLWQAPGKSGDCTHPSANGANFIQYSSIAAGYIAKQHYP